MIKKMGDHSRLGFLLGALLLAPVIAWAGEGEPAIIFEETLHDFGTAYEDEKVIHIFKFTNEGSGALQITDTKTSCGCTAAIGTKDLIPPGGSSQIEVTYSVGKGTGDRSRTVTVSSNDPDNPQVQLTIKGKIKGVYVTEPANNTVRFQAVPLGESQVQTLRIFPEGEVSFQIKGTKFYKADTNLKVDVEDTSGSEKKGKILKVTLKGQQDVGRFSERFEIYTDLDKAETISITVLGDIVGPIEVSPPQIRVVFGEPKQTEARATVKLKRRDGKSFNVIRALAEVPHITVNLRKPEAGLQPAVVDFTVRKEGQVRSGRSTVRVFTDDPQQSVISIPITWVIPRPSPS